MALPLSDITVVELGEAVAGPLAGMMFADMGAEVVKIESPDGGDALRGMGGLTKDGVGTYFFWVNRNKQSLCLDIGTDRGRDAFLSVAETADVVIENYRPGVVDDLGVGYEDVSQVNDDVIYCHISGFGQETAEAYEGRVANDTMMQAATGGMSITGTKEQPARSGVIYADLTTGMYAAFSIFAALRHRERTGDGQEIDMAIWDVQLFNLGPYAFQYLVNDEVPGRLGTKYPFCVPYQAFRTADEEFIVLVAYERQWEEFCEHVIDRPDLLTDERFETNADRVENRDILEPILEAEMEARTFDELSHRLNQVNILWSPINDIDDVVDHPVTEARGLTETIDHPIIGETEILGFPGKMAEIEYEIERIPPLLGENSIEVLAEAGFSDGDIDAMLADGIVQRPTERAGDSG